MTRILYVTNLSTETTESDLEQIFVPIGQVLSIRIPVHPDTHLQKDYAFIEMESLELATAAVDSLNDHVLYDRKLKISVVPLPEERKTLPRADLSPIKVKPPGRTGRPRTR